MPTTLFYRIILISLICSLIYSADAPTDQQVHTNTPFIAPEDIFNACQLKYSSNFQLENGTFQIEDKVAGNSPQDVFWWRPSAPAPLSSEIVFYAPFPNENIEEGGMEAKSLASMCGFTVFSIPFKTATKSNVEIDLDDHQTFYIYQECGYFDAIKHGYSELIARLKLKDRPIFTGGFSGGGIIAQRLAEYWPGHIAGVASYGGRRFAIKTRAHCPFLFICNVGDLSEPELDGVALLYKKEGDPVINSRSLGEWNSFGDPQALFMHHPRSQDQVFFATWLGGISDPTKRDSQ